MSVEEGLSDLIFRDELTGLYNRRYISKFFKSDSLYSTMDDISLVIVDLDNFKKINDNFGHQEGDRLIAGIGGMFSEFSKESKHIVARYGGDEFLFILLGKSKEAAYDIALELRDSFNEKIIGENSKWKKHDLGISAGVATYPSDERDLTNVLKCADKALYASKNIGGNKITVYSDVNVKHAERLNVLQNIQNENIVARPSEVRSVVENINKFQNKESDKWFIIVEGELGVGKTMFLKAVMNELRNRDDNHIILKKCQPFDSLVPYGLIREFLFSLLKDDENRKVVDEITSEKQKVILSRIIPEIYSFVEEAQFSKEEIYELLLLVFSRFSDKKPLIFMIDNGFYVDEASYAVLHEFVNISESKPLVFMTSSYEEAPNLPKFISFKTSIVEYTEKVILEELEREECTDFLKGVLGGYDVGMDFADIVYDITSGNPLGMSCLLKECLLSDSITLENGKWIMVEDVKKEMTTGVKAKIKDILDNMDEKSLQLLSDASVAGEKIEFELLKEVLTKRDSRFSEGEIISTVDRLVKENVLSTEDPIDLTEIEFSSAYFQKTVYESIPEEEKKNTHRNIAEIQEERHKDNPELVQQQLFYHYDKAGEAEKARHYAEKIRNEFIEMFDENELRSYVKNKVGAARSEIPEYSHAIDGKVVNDILSFTKDLITTIKSVRIYPEESSVVVNLNKSSYDLLKNILDGSKGFTVSADEEGLKVNQAAINDVGDENRKNDFLKFLGEKRIQSITFTPETDISQYRILINILLNEIETEVVDESFWEKLAARFRLKSVGVVTYSYLGAGSDKSGDTTTPIFEVIKQFNAMLELSRVYPPTNKIIEDRVNEFLQIFGGTIGEEGCYISLSGSDLLFNGNLIDSSGIEGFTDEIVGMFRRLNLNSIVFLKGLAPDGMKMFIGFCESTRKLPPEEMSSELSQRKFDGILIERKEFVKKTVSEPKEVKVTSPSERAGLYLDMTDQEYLHVKHEKIIELISALINQQGSIWFNLVKRYVDIAEKNPKYRRPALNGLISVAEPFFDQVNDKIDMDILIDDSIEKVTPRNHFLSRYISGLLASGSEELNATLKRVSSLKTHDDIYSSAANFFMKERLTDSLRDLEIAHFVNFARFVEDKEQLLSNLIEVGTGDVGRLSAILNGLKAHGFGIYSPVLSSNNDDFIVSLLQYIMPDKPEEIKFVMDRMLASGRLILLQQIIGLLHNKSPQLVIDYLKGYISETADKEGLKLMLRVISALRLPGFEGEVYTVMESADDEKLILLCITYLSNNSYNNSFYKLREYVTRKKGFFKIKYYYKDSVRSRALLALSKMSNEEVKQIISSALNDRSEEVKAAANVAYNELTRRS